tara:strand:+ start:827 stop:1204 length:378 start_codon:yes stop_codon:yes gene_type:complete
MPAKNNNISLEQWNQLMKAVDHHIDETSILPNDILYRGSRSFGVAKRYYCYDNYDRYYHPGLDLVISDNAEVGKLTVYNATENARAPISFKESMQIARNFFNDYGGEMAETIVCEWVMDGNASTF